MQASQSPIPTLAETQLESLARTLAAYALNLLHGAKLDDFERRNLIDLAARIRVEIGPAHLKMESAAHRAAQEQMREMARLRILTYTPQPWWRALLGRKAKV